VRRLQVLLKCGALPRKQSELLPRPRERWKELGRGKEKGKAHLKEYTQNVKNSERVSQKSPLNSIFYSVNWGVVHMPTGISFLES
jgi:hypothetical protein